MNILVIDDQEDIRKLIQLCLKKTIGTNVFLVDNGLTGIEMAKTQPIDVILLDENMPIISGSQTLKILKSTAETSAIPVIFLTANNLEIVQELRELDTASVLRKPFNPITLLTQIKNIVSQDQLSR